MFDGDLLSRCGRGFRRIVHHMHTVVSIYMGYHFIAQCEKSILMGFFILMNMNRRYLERIIAFGYYFLTCSVLVILPDVYHQHMQMQ